MAEVLVLVEHAEGALKKVSTELITAARALGEPSAVVAGPAGTAAKLADALAAAGAEKIYVAESDDIDGYLVTPKVDVLAALVESTSPAAVITAAGTEGKEVAGRLAARLGSGLLTDVIEIKADGTGRPLHLRWRVHRRGQGQRRRSGLLGSSGRSRGCSAGRRRRADHRRGSGSGRECRQGHLA